jgi:hypothetical protein
MEPSTPTPLVFPLVAIYNENPDHSVTINGTYPLRRQWGAPNEIYDGLPGWWFNGISLLSAAGQAAAAWLNAERDAATPRHRIYHLVIQQRESSRRAIIETLKGVNEYASGPKVYRYWLCHTGGRIEEIPINEQPEPAGAVIKPPLNFP